MKKKYTITKEEQYIKLTAGFLVDYLSLWDPNKEIYIKDFKDQKPPYKKCQTIGEYIEFLKTIKKNKTVYLFYSLKEKNDESKCIS